MHPHPPNVRLIQTRKHLISTAKFITLPRTRHRGRLGSEAEIIAFASANGVDGAKLGEAMKSFSANTKANRAKQLADAYKIDGVPAIGINGRFYTSATLAGSHERAVAVADFLIQLSRTKA